MRLTIHRILPVGCLTFSPSLQRVLTVANPKSPILTVQSSCRKMSGWVWLRGVAIPYNDLVKYGVKDSKDTV